MTAELKRIGSADIETHWSVLESYLAPAMRRGDSPLSSDDLKALALAGKRLLLAVVDGDDLLAVASTGIRSGRDGDVAFVDFCGGEGMGRWLRPCLIDLERRAKEAGAVAFEIEEGRTGFRRLLADYRPVRVVLRKELTDG